jgi:hypothetical protein
VTFSPVLQLTRQVGAAGGLIHSSARRRVTRIIVRRIVRAPQTLTPLLSTENEGISVWRISEMFTGKRIAGDTYQQKEH